MKKVMTMSASKLDRRKKYTQMVLKDSLMKHLKEKQISTITVKEICELADINRSNIICEGKGKRIFLRI